MESCNPISLEENLSQRLLQASPTRTMTRTSRLMKRRDTGLSSTGVKKAQKKEKAPYGCLLATMITTRWPRWPTRFGARTCLRTARPSTSTTTSIGCSSFPFWRATTDTMLAGLKKEILAPSVPKQYGTVGGGFTQTNVAIAGEHQ